MPKLVFTNPGVRDSVSRPVVLDIVRQLLKWTGLPENTQIQFPGDSEKMMQPGSAISNVDEMNEFNMHNQWAIEVDESYQEDRALSMAVFDEENIHTFWDGDTFVYLRPAYSPTNITITVKHRETDKDSMIRWRDEIRTRVAMNRQARVHAISYSYLIPHELLPVLEEIHRLRETVAPYGETFEQYLERYKSTKMRKLSTLAGTQLQWGVAENQTRVLGYFDFDFVPDTPQKGDEDSTSNTSFTYTFKFDKPVATVMQYPLMIHNQLITKKYRPTKLPPRLEDNILNYTISSRALATWEAYRPSENQGQPGIAIPEFDEFLPANGSVPPDTLRVVTALTSIDPENSLELLRLDQLGDQDIDPDVLDYMRGETPWLTRLGTSMIHVNVYRGLLLMEAGSYEVTSDLMVRLRDVPSLRDTFHVRMSIYQRPRLLPTVAKDRLRNHCRAAQKLLIALDPYMERRGQVPMCMADDYMAKAPLNDALDTLDSKFDTKYNGQIYQFNTVMVLFVEANRK